ncbi:hypothetical protein HU200_036130 [Digitaria exilis]|uniref:Peptidase A1 domain-containing protein n=1 Tax=Digitaria exilis TaxID=1010633 RepID=A0A835EID2_9POAL|nr:hypothetical protein HU200_036130 [Digitaria exilis]
METKLTTSFVLITALLIQQHRWFAIADHNTRALRLFASHEGSSYSYRRGSDGFLYYLKHSLSDSSANMTMSPKDNDPEQAILTIGTGTAEHKYTLKLDATSPLSWIQCEPCVPHAPQKGPIFSPNGEHTHSPSYRPLAPSDEFCKPENGMEPAGEQCAFHVSGAGGMSVHGYVAQLPEWRRVRAGKAPASLTMQLVARGMTRFSYCLTRGISRQGFLRFGADVPRNSRYKTTRILPALDASEADYYVDLVGVSLGERRLDRIHRQMFTRGKDGEGGSVIDLGTPVTVMAEEAYRVVEETMWSELKEHGAERVERRGYGLCVRVTKSVKGHLQSLSLHFAQGEEATLVVSPEQLFLMMVDEHAGEIACLAMVPGHRTIIGALQ